MLPWSAVRPWVCTPSPSTPRTSHHPTAKSTQAAYKYNININSTDLRARWLIEMYGHDQKNYNRPKHHIHFLPRTQLNVRGGIWRPYPTRDPMYDLRQRFEITKGCRRTGGLLNVEPHASWPKVLWLQCCPSIGLQSHPKIMQDKCHV